MNERVIGHYQLLDVINMNYETENYVLRETQESSLQVPTLLFKSQFMNQHGRDTA